MNTLYAGSRTNSWTTNPTEAKAPKKNKNKNKKREGVVAQREGVVAQW
jgi:hypothetical protein